jgi:hypothetical protein
LNHHRNSYKNGFEVFTQRAYVLLRIKLLLATWLGVVTRRAVAERLRQPSDDM